MVDIDRFRVVLGSTLPGAAPLTRTQWETLAWLSPELLVSVDRDQRLLVSAVMISARTSVGRVDDALELARRELERTAVGGSLDPAREGAAELLVAVAEAHATAGASRETALFADKAAAMEGALPAVVYRAQGLSALATALNGEYASATTTIAAADERRLEHGWEASAADFPLLLARVLVASAALDALALSSLAEQFRAIGGSSAIWRSTALAVDAMADLVRFDVGAGIAKSRLVGQSTAEGEVLMMIRGFARGIHADLLLLRGDAPQALALLRDEPSTPDHSLCFDMQRAAAWLALGRPRDALRTTDGCLRLGHRHCLRTIPPLLLRRAVAWERLGRPERADSEFAEAFHLVQSSGSLTPLLTVPRVETLALLHRFAAAHEGHRAAVEVLLTRLALVPVSSGARPVVPTLTKREEATARALYASTTHAELAAQLSVSVNTVKVHLRNLYAKLGVTNKHDAVDLLQSSGFFELP
ncbi:response regulator transcription factor [Herbiconiux sp. A18JL235]|uniref:Response regulator transcription factor n=1 Tax=Herbiconiux sp. A18JL235 TaxID=3152363 RepID=A0AB39BGA9_9MICO